MRYIITLILSVISSVLYAQSEDSLSRFTDTLLMHEVAISAKLPISIKGDTVSYRVDSFNKNPLATIEEVLKKLPGVEVDEQGNITAHGKRVDRIYLNGKEFQIDDITDITQSLPANIIQKVQVADYHSESEIFSGVKQNAETKIVNFRLKKDYNSGIVGRAAGGYGSKGRYQAGAFINHIAKNANRTTLIGSVSNTGVARVSNTDNKSSMWHSPGISERQRGSVNFSLGSNSKWDLVGTYSYSDGTNYLEQNTIRTTFLRIDSAIRQGGLDKKNSNDNRHNLHLKSSAKFKDDFWFNTKVDAYYSIREIVSNTQDVTFGDQIGEALNFKRVSENNGHSNNANFSIKNSIMKRLGKAGRTIIVNADVVSNSIVTNNIRNNSNTYYDPYSENNISNKSENDNREYTSRLGLNYNEPINKRLSFSLSYYAGYERSFADNQVSILDTDLYVIDSNQSSKYRNTNIEHNGGFETRFISGKISTGVGLNIIYYKRNSNEELNNNNTIRQEGVNYAPDVFFEYKVSKKTNLQLGYNGNVQTPSIRQLQPVPNYSDSLNVYIGNPNLKPQVQNNVMFRYNFRNMKGSSFWINTNMNWQVNNFVNKTEITSSKRVTTPINSNGNYRLWCSLNWTEPIIKKQLNINVSAHSSTLNRVVIINNVTNNLKTYEIRPTLRLSYTSKKSLETNLTCMYRWSEVGAVNSKNILRGLNVLHESNIGLPFKFRWSYNVSYTYNNGINSNFQQSFLLVSTSIDKSFEKMRKLSLRFQVFDIFNDYPTVSRRVGDSYFEDISVNRLGRYMLFSVIYKFTSFPRSEAK